MFHSAWTNPVNIPRIRQEVRGLIARGSCQLHSFPVLVSTLRARKEFRCHPLSWRLGGYEEYLLCKCATIFVSTI